MRKVKAKLFTWCRWCGARYNANSGSVLCAECRQDKRLVAMVRPYRGADTRSWEKAYGIDAGFAALDIFERDGWVCGICGDPIDRHLRFPEPLSAALDHITPLPEGENTPENVRASHFRCNGTRTRKTPDPEAPLRHLQGAAHSRVLEDATNCDPTAESALENLAHDGIQRALGFLPTRERRILELRFGFAGDPWTLDEIGRELDLTRERVRQLEGEALTRLAALRDLAAMTRRVSA